MNSLLCAVITMGVRNGSGVASPGTETQQGSAALCAPALVGARAAWTPRAALRDRTSRELPDEESAGAGGLPRRRGSRPGQQPRRSRAATHRLRIPEPLDHLFRRHVITDSDAM